MACDTAVLLEQAKCIITCIPPGMMPAVNAALLCQIAGSVGSGLYVLKTGDTMTGALLINNGVLVASSPALDISQTWNNGAINFDSLKVNILNTASAATDNSLIRLQENSIDKFRVDETGRTFISRQVADNAPIIWELRKRGTTGNATAPVAANDNICRLDFRGWNGTSYAGAASILMQAAETFTGIANGASLIFGVAAIGSISATTKATLNGTSFSLASGVAYHLAGVALHNPLTVYAAGAVYTLTAVSAAVDFGTTDPIITVNAAGTYAIRARIRVALNAATFAANQTLTVKLRRTNNTAADVANSSATWVVPIVTAQTNTLAVIILPEVLYTTALTTDTIQLFSDISVVPSAGTISIDAASIVAVRLS